MKLETVRTRLMSLSALVATVAGLSMLAVAVIVTVDVLLRRFFSVSLGGANELSGLIFAVATTLALPFVLLDRVSIRIDVAYSHLPVRLRAILDLVAVLSVLGFTFLLARASYGIFWNSWVGNHTSVGLLNVPLWIPQLFWSLGYWLSAASAAFIAIYALLAIFRRDWDSVGKAAGIPSLEDVIEEETYIDAETISTTVENSSSSQEKK